MRDVWLPLTQEQSRCIYKKGSLILWTMQKVLFYKNNIKFTFTASIHTKYSDLDMWSNHSTGAGDWWDCVGGCTSVLLLCKRYVHLELHGRV